MPYPMDHENCIKLGSILRNGGNRSEQHFTAVNCILTEKGIKIQPQPTEKEAKTFGKMKKISC